MNRSKPQNELSLDELQLALSIAEGPSLKVRGSKLLDSGGRRFRRLGDLGALICTGRAKTIICKECDRRHPATVTFDRELQAMTYFCREAGRVRVDPGALEIYELQLGWLLGWLADALRISVKQRPLSLIKDHLWELGEANIHHQRLRVIVARQVGALVRLTEIETTAARRTGKTGVILTTSSGFTEPHRLPSGFSMIGLSEVLARDQSAASVDLDRLLSIAEPEATIDPYGTGLPGQRSGAHLVEAEHESRIKEGNALEKIGDEARALECWYAENHPDGPPLTAGTLENRIREKHNRYKATLMSTK